MGKTINPLWEQDSAQGFNDGTESGSTTKAAVNTGWTQLVDQTFLYRILIQETNGATTTPTFAVRLQARLNSGTWFQVTTSSTIVKIVDSASLTHGGDTTQRIGVDTDWVTNNNWVADTSGDTNTTTDTFGTGIAADVSECEALWAVQIVSGDVSDSDTIEFQAVQTNDTVLNNYVSASIFTITVSTASPDLTDSFTDDLDNWLDATDILLHHEIAETSDLNNWSDSITVSHDLHIADDLDNWLDDAVSGLSIALTAVDNIRAPPFPDPADGYSALLEHFLTESDALSLSDVTDFFLEHFLTTSDDLDNWLDSISVELSIAVDVSDSLHNWNDGDHNLINESFEGAGYEDPNYQWESVGTNDILDEDSTAITPPTGFGSQILEAEALSPDYRAYANWDWGSDTYPCYFRVYFNLAAFEAAGVSVKDKEWLVFTSSTEWIFIASIYRKTVGDGGDLRLSANVNGGSWGLASTVLSLDTWYCLEGKFDRDANSWEIRLDGVVFHSGTYDGNESATGPTDLDMGWTWHGGAADYTGKVYFDGLAVSTQGWISSPEKTLSYEISVNDTLSLSDGFSKSAEQFITASDDLDNWNDSSIEFELDYLLDVVSNLNNWDDSASVQLSIAVTESDDLDSWLDSVDRFSAGYKTFSDTLTLSDGFSKFAEQFITASDDLDNWNDAEDLVLSYEISLADDLNNWNDAVTRRLSIAVDVSDSLHSWNDGNEDLIKESFEGAGYEDPNFDSETVGTNDILDEDSTSVSPPTGFGSQVLEAEAIAPDYQAYATWDFGSHSLLTYWRVYFYLDDYAVAGASNKSSSFLTIVDYSAGTQAAAYVTRLTGGGLRLSLQNTGGGDPTGDSWNQDTSLSLGQWYCLEYKHDVEGDTFEWKLDGPSILSGVLNGENSQDGVDTARAGFIWHSPGEVCSGKIYFDGLAVSTEGWISTPAKTLSYEISTSDTSSLSDGFSVGTPAYSFGVSDDLNNWSDSEALILGYEITLSDDLDNWLDDEDHSLDAAGATDLPITEGSDLNSWTDAAKLRFRYLLTHSDDIENWNDEQLLGHGLLPSESIHSWNDGDHNLINESFEGAGYEDPNWWFEVEGTNDTADEDNTDITPPSGFGSQVFKAQAASPDYDARAAWKWGTAEQVVYARAYFNLAAFEAAGAAQKSKSVFNVNVDSGGSYCQVAIVRESTGAGGALKLGLWVTGGGDPSGGYWDQETDISLDTWYKVEFKVDLDADLWEIRLDDSTIASGSYNGEESAVGVETVDVGWTWHGGSEPYTGTIYFDGLAVSTQGWVSDPAKELGYEISTSDALSLSDGVTFFGDQFLTPSDDLNNWLDNAQVVRSADSISVSDDLNNWLDNEDHDLEGGADLTKSKSDDLNNWSDSVKFIWPLTLSFTDDLDSWADSPISFEFDYLLDITSNLNNWSDAEARILSYEISTSDDLNNWLDDENHDLGAGVTDLPITKGSDLDSWSDVAKLRFRHFLTRSDDLDSWNDSHSKSLIGLLGLGFNDDVANWLDAQGAGHGQLHTDSITFSDGVTRNMLHRMLKSDAMSFSDSLQKELEHRLALDDQFTLDDGVIVTIVYLSQFADTLTLTDAYKLILGYLIKKGDTLNLSDGIQSLYSHQLSLADTLTITDGIELFGQILLSKSDAMSLSDFKELLLAHFLTFSDTMAFADGFQKFLDQEDLQWEPSDILTLSDAIQMFMEHFMSQSDTMTLTDAISVAASLTDEFSDTLTLSDAYSKILGYLIAQSDILSMSDARQVLLEHLLALSDSFTLTDAQVQLVGQLLAYSDTLTLTDAQNLLLSHLLNLTDTLSLSDASILTIEDLIAESDTLALSDDIQLLLGYLLQLSDALSMSDGRNVDLGGISDYEEQKSDTLTFSDSFAAILHHFLTKSDTLTISDGFQVVMSLLLADLSDDLDSWVDNVARAYGLTLQKSDTLALSDASLLGLRYLLSKSDTMSASDGISMLMLYFLSISDVMTLTDASSLINGYLKAISDDADNWNDSLVKSLGISIESGSDLDVWAQAIAMQISHWISVGDGLTLVDGISKFAEYFLTKSDTLNLSDGITRIFGYLKVLSDNLSNWSDNKNVQLLGFGDVPISEASDLAAWNDAVSTSLETIASIIKFVNEALSEPLLANQEITEVILGDEALSEVELSNEDFDSSE